MAEEIPLRPFDPHEKGGDEHTYEHEHETSFGGGDVIDPDDYANEESRRRARIVIDTLRENGLRAPKEYFYGFNEEEKPIVSKDKRNWYKLELGQGINGEELVGLVPIDFAPPPPDDMKVKLGLEVGGNVNHGLEVDTDETTPLINKGDILNQAVEEEVISTRPNVKLALLRFELDSNGKLLVSGKYGKKWTKFAQLYNYKGEINENLPKSVKDALGKSATEVLKENQDQIDKNTEIQNKNREEFAKIMEERHDSLLNEVKRMEKSKQELESEVSELKSRQNQINVELMRGKEEQKEMQKLMKRKETEMKRMQAKLSEMERGNTDVTGIIDFKKEIDQYEASMDAYDKKIKEKDEENDRLSKELEEFHKTNDEIIQSLEERSAQIERNIADIREMANETQDYMKKHGGMLQEAKKQVEIEKAVTDRVRRELNLANDKLRKSTSQAERDRLNKEITELQRRLTESNERSSKLQRDLTEIRQREEENERLSEQNEEIEEENEGILSRMSLKERVKAIFRKYGVTIVGILAAVGSVIATIVTNLKSGLQKLAKGVGEGFKEIGSKLGQILPGMIGAIVSFLFKAAGEAVSFLAKNSWLLILLVVTFAVDQFKVKKPSRSDK